MQPSCFLPILLLLLGVGDVCAAKKTWTAIEYFEGLWNVEKLGYTNDAKINGTFNLTKGAYDGWLLGAYVTKIGALQDPILLELSSTSPLSGSFAMKGITVEDEEDDFDNGEIEAASPHASTLLRFDFFFYRSPQGMLISQGPFKGQQGQGTYHFVVPTADQFILTLFPKDSSSQDITTYVGRKVSEKPEPSFFQKFGPTGMIIIVFMASKLFSQSFFGKSRRVPDKKK